MEWIQELSNPWRAIVIVSAVLVLALLLNYFWESLFIVARKVFGRSKK